MLRSHWSLCVWFSRTTAWLCTYGLFIWSNLNFLRNSLWIILPTQSCLVLNSFCVYLLHSLIMLLIVLSYYNYYHFLILRIKNMSTHWKTTYQEILVFSYFGKYFLYIKKNYTVPVVSAITVNTENVYINSSLNSMPNLSSCGLALLTFVVFAV